MYIGSVKFFKHLILCVLSILIVTPSILCVVLFGRLTNVQSQLSAVETNIAQLSTAADTQEQAPKSTGDDTISVDNAADISVAGSIANGKVKKETEIAYQSIYPHLYADIPKEQTKKDKVIYLTFDDGPSENTIAVLDTLDKYQIKACFFVTATGKSNERYKALLQDIVNRGHTLAIHTYSHEYKKIYASVDAYLEDFNKIYELIYDTTGYKPTIFRFPGGSINGYSAQIYQEIIAEMTRRGFLYYDWNVSAQDASNSATVQSITNSVLTGVDKVNRGIVLMHDSIYTTNTIHSLPAIIEGILARGYTIEQLTNEVAPIIFSYQN